MNLNATLFVQLIVFLILAIFTAKFVWPPLMKALDERSKKIAEGLEAAERSKQEVVAVEKRVQVQLAEARDEAQRRITQAEQRAQILADEIKQNAEKKAQQMLAEAKAEADAQMAKARDALRAEIANLTVKGAEQILKREIDASAHADILKQLEKEL